MRGRRSIVAALLTVALTLIPEALAARIGA
jgi:hypothetical protein